MSWGVIGQERAVSLLRRAVESGRLAHAYLFVGPERVGRATTARAFAQALNCERLAKPPAEVGGMTNQAADFQSAGTVPCGACRPCKMIAEDKHPDVEWVGVGGICDESDHRDHSADNSRDIRICQIRRLERVISRTTVDARYRVVIVDPADAMTVEAANAFLKTLEEPAPNTILVLLSAREERLRETVRSRCRRIVFYGVPREDIERALQERWGADAQQAGHLARLSQGRLGWAVAALQDDRLLIDREKTLDAIESVLAGTFGDRFKYAAGLGSGFSKDPQMVRTSLDVWCDWWRDVLVTAAGHEDLVLDSERLDTLRTQASQYGVAGALEALKAIMGGRRHLEEHASPTLAMESMLLELPLARSRS
jgi:DNA polymerase-3 subunit delta'